MMTQTDIAKMMGCSQTAVNFMLNGIRRVTWPQADKLNELFPGKDIKYWKKATPAQLVKAFSKAKEPKNGRAA